MSRIVTPIPSALEFDDLPSDRNSEHTPAGRLIRELASTCYQNGPYGCWGLLSDRALRTKRRIQNGEEVGELHWLIRPGGFIEERCTPEQRALLRGLTSEDVADAPLTELMTMDEGYAGPGVRWKFGPYCEIKETLPTVWKLGR